MDFDYSPDQRFLQEEARRFLAANCPTSKVRKVLDGADVPFDRELWRAIGEQGWLAAIVPTEFGGLGMSRVDLCAISEELGRAVAPVPFASTVYFLTEALLKYGSDAQRARWLPKIAAGDCIGAAAFAEAPGAITPASINATVKDGRLAGVKVAVTDGDVADVALVLARENGRLGLYLAELGGADVQREMLKSLDPTRSVATVTFNETPVERLGQEEGIEQMDRLLERAAVYIAFEQVGGSDRCLEMAKDYAFQRMAFGRAIAGYQAIKHKLADIYVGNQVARSNAYHAAWALEADAPELPLTAATARVAGCDAYWFASKESIETHGGIGFTWEADCHIFYRRCRQLAAVAGSPRLWGEKIVAELERVNAQERKAA